MIGRFKTLDAFSTSSILRDILEKIVNKTFSLDIVDDRNVKMQTLNFTLAPEEIVRVHDAVLCLAKFNEMVGFEAHGDKVDFPILF